MNDITVKDILEVVTMERSILFLRIVGYGQCAAQFPGCNSRLYVEVVLYQGKVCRACYRAQESLRLAQQGRTT